MNSISSSLQMALKSDIQMTMKIWRKLFAVTNTVIDEPRPMQYQTQSDTYCREHISFFNWTKNEVFPLVSSSGLSLSFFNWSFSRSSMEAFVWQDAINVSSDKSKSLGNGLCSNYRGHKWIEWHILKLLLKGISQAYSIILTWKNFRWHEENRSKPWYRAYTSQYYTQQCQR